MSLDIETARRNMVEQQVRGWDVLDHRVLDVLASVPREAFVSEAWRELAFADLALPLGHGEVMMKPVVEGRLLQALSLSGNESVLEIGTGSGFLTACLARLGNRVTSLEYRAELAESARQRLAAHGIDNVDVVIAEAVTEWQAPHTFDAIVVGGAVARFPQRWLSWLKPGGRSVAVVGRSPSMQAVLANASASGELDVRHLFETDLPYLLHAAPEPQFTL